MKNAHAEMEEVRRGVNIGQAQEPRRPKWRNHAERITRLKAEYRLNNRTLEEYWAAVTHAVATFDLDHV